MKSPKPPKAPDPGAIAGQQYAQNKKNAFLQSAFNRPNQTDAFGNTLTWNQTGTDANKNPIFSATQQLGSLGQKYSQGLASLGQKYFDQAGNTEGLSSNDALDRAYQFATANITPRFDRNREAELSRLRNMGLDSTSEAYRTSMNDLSLQQNEALNNLVTGLQGQMYTQGLQTRQQGMNELTPGVNFGEKVLSPNLVSVPQVASQAPNMGDLNSQMLQQQNLAYQGKLADRNAMMGGLASIGGQLASVAFGGF